MSIPILVRASSMISAACDGSHSHLTPFKRRPNEEISYFCFQTSFLLENFFSQVALEFQSTRMKSQVARLSVTIKLIHLACKKFLCKNPVFLDPCMSFPNVSRFSCFWKDCFAFSKEMLRSICIKFPGSTPVTLGFGRLRALLNTPPFSCTHSLFFLESIVHI